MDSSIEEVYAMFGELVCVQGITMKRLQAQVAELDERLMLAQRHIKKLEGKDDAGSGDDSDNDGRTGSELVGGHVNGARQEEPEAVAKSLDAEVKSGG